MACPTSAGSSTACSGRGLCLSLRQAGLGYDGFRLTNPPVQYGLWDADRVMGCVCDIGWWGADCSKRACPSGDDPLTTAGQLPEVQALSCTCGATCSGALVLSYAGRTRSLLYNAVASIADEGGASGSGSGPGESLESVLESLAPQDTFATVAFSVGSSGPMCAPGGNVATITFNRGAGNAPQLAAGLGSLDSTSGVRTVAIATVRNGTTESVQCSNRGVCDSTTGACTCAAGFTASDGNGGIGSIGDCGYQVTPASVACPVAITSTSGNAALTCGGRGTCSGAPGYTCACYTGYGGPACEQVLCPVAAAWFDEPSAPNTAHGLVECANRGVCNRWNGTCACAPGFTGAACERGVCPSTDASTPCSGNGRCLPLRALAGLGTRQGAAVGSLEVQALTCTYTSGGFSLGFGYASTAELPPYTTPAALKAALEGLPTIGFVDVSTVPTGATAICGAGPAGVVTSITFTTEPAPQQLLVATQVTPPAAGSVTVARTTTGTRASYGSVDFAPATWDADALYGCACDAYPDLNKTAPVVAANTAASAAAPLDIGLWVGPACSRRSCPYGSDPEGPASGSAFGWVGSENQTLTCTASGGTFTLTFRGSTTAPIDAGGDAAALQAALEALPSVGRVDVGMAGGATALCSSSGSGTVTTVSFRSELGDLPQLVADASGLVGGTVTVATAADGTGTNEECAGRGLCDGTSGLCTCFEGYMSSNGFRAPGRRGDCGANMLTAVRITATP